MFPAANSQQRLSTNSANKASRKVPLKPGRSLVDWVRLTKSGKDLRGTGPRLLQITSDELSKHNKPNDLWMALRGMVYNVTDYLEYHPGGADELMRGAGKDATSLFEQVHRWVNYESMLKECLVGKLNDTTKPTKLLPSRNMLAPPPHSVSSLNPLGRNTMKIDSISGKNNSVPQITLKDFAVPSNRGLTTSTEPVLDWYQTKKNVNFVFYTKFNDFKKHQVVCDIEDRKEAFVDLHIGKIVHSFNILLQEPVLDSISIVVSQAGKVQISLTKSDFDIHWNTIGTVKHSHKNFAGQDINKMRFCEATIIYKQMLTHDTSLYHVKLPCSRWMSVPIGYHVYLRVISQGIEICKPYTPVLKTIIGDNDESEQSYDCDLYLIIKHYEGGGLTSTLKGLSQGDKISVSTYDGDYDSACSNKFLRFIFLAAGTGVTPMIRVLCSILHKRNDCIAHFLFFNKNEKDVIWNSEFKLLSEAYQDNFIYKNILSQAEESWNGKRGRISKEILEECLPDNVENDKLFFFVCGPTQFTKLSLSIIEQIGYQNVHAFT